MKAHAKCPTCGKSLTTDCRGCIDGEGFDCAEGECSCEFEDNVKIKWIKVPENEEELKEVDSR